MFTGTRLDDLLEGLNRLEYAISYMLNPGTLASELAGSEEIRIPEGMKIFFGSPLTFWNVGLHELIKDLMSLERRSDLEKLLGDFLHMELEGEFQWLRKHYLHEDCKGAGSIAADPKALDAIMITLTAAKARSKAQSMEIENLPRRISSLQTLVRTSIVVDIRHG